MTLTAIQTSSGVLPLIPALITCRRVLLTYASPNAACTTIYFVSDIKSVCGAAIIVTILRSILRFIVGTTAGRFWLLNIFCSKFPLLVSVTSFFLLLV